jgi:hypothetical protein
MNQRSTNSDVIAGHGKHIRVTIIIIGQNNLETYNRLSELAFKEHQLKAKPVIPLRLERMLILISSKSKNRTSSLMRRKLLECILT